MFLSSGPPALRYPLNITFHVWVASLRLSRSRGRLIKLFATGHEEEFFDAPRRAAPPAKGFNHRLPLHALNFAVNSFGCRTYTTQLTACPNDETKANPSYNMRRFSQIKSHSPMKEAWRRLSYTILNNLRLNSSLFLPGERKSRAR